MEKILVGVFLASLWASPVFGQGDEELSRATSAVVGIVAEIPPRARTAAFLGTTRRGSGVVIDDKGLIVTIGYLVLEAKKIVVLKAGGKTVKATMVGYDSNSGIGMVRALEPLGVKPLQFGDSSKMKPESRVVIVHFGSQNPVDVGVIVSRRNFAGYWEYLLEDAIFAVPPIAEFAGAALLNSELKLVGIGSLFVQDTLGSNINLPGNMFVPSDRVFSVLADLIRSGKPAGPPKPWLGVNVAETFGRVVVTRVSKGGPAEKSGIGVGDIVLSVGGEEVKGMEDFFRKIWALGAAGVTARVKILRGAKIEERSIQTADRYANYHMYSVD